MSKSLPVMFFFLLPLIFLFIWNYYIENEYWNAIHFGVSLSFTPSSKAATIEIRSVIVAFDSSMALPPTLIELSAYTQKTVFSIVRRGCYLYREGKVYTFIFPIIILLSFTRREHCVRWKAIEKKIPPVCTSNTNISMAFFFYSPFLLCILRMDIQGKSSERN